ncbi:MAG: hypothetical protein H0W42_11185, partial [Gemmatimonadaceae bacterium]|nr:hypothetical protein [Gemmatimonadaceae bacterium]
MTLLLRRQTEIAANLVAQSAPEPIDFDALAQGPALTGVISGCAVSVTGANMTVTVAAGVVRHKGRRVVVAGGGVTAVTDGSNPRRAIVSVNTSGTLAITHGTAAASPYLPNASAIPANSVVIAAVDIPAATTAVTTAMLTDKAVPVPELTWHDARHYPTLQDALNAASTFGGIVTWEGTLTVNAAQVTIPANVTLQGLGRERSILTLTGAAVYGVITGGAGAGIQDCTVNCTAGDRVSAVELAHSNTFARRCLVSYTSTGRTGTARCISASNQDGNGQPRTDIVIEGNLCTGGSAQLSGIVVSEAPRVRIVGNRVYSITNTAALAADKRRCWAIYISYLSPNGIIHDNHVYSTNTSGIHVNADPGTGSGPETGQHGHRVTNNTVEGVTYMGMAVENVYNPYIAGNKIRTCHCCLRLGTATSGLGHVQGGRVVGNHFGDLVVSDTSISVALYDIYANDVVSIGNEIDDRGTGATLGIDVRGDRVTLIGEKMNALRPERGILVNSGADDCHIIDCEIPASTSATTGGGIYAVQLAALRGSIDGGFYQSGASRQNILLNENDCQVRNARIDLGDRNVQTAAAKTGILIEGNRLSGAGNADAINNVAGVGAVIRNNHDYIGNADDEVAAFLLSADLSATATTISNFFGANSAVSLPIGAYRIEFDAFFLKNTAGTLVWTITCSAAPASLNARLHADAVAGVGSGANATAAP